NGKTGLYKVPISIEELFSPDLDTDAIRSLAKAPREFSINPSPTAQKTKTKQNIIELWKELVREVESEGPDNGALSFMACDPPYIQSQSHRSQRIGSEEEAKAVRFLVKYWRRGYRNQLEMAFLGFCLKRGVGYDSVRRIIERVCDLTKDEEKAARLKLVDYHYRTRLSLGRRLLAVSGLREMVREAIK
ncbi:hypothetical protein KEJ19_07460, partial [Candidatus Bathyarchaeota archaeon]|nr:hypothetical protein [Candidatus Bathyarchaeota archaeon]